MALKLDILANTRQFTSEMKQAGAGVEDISDALDTMAKDGKDAGTDLERTFRDLARESEDAGRKVGKGLDDGFDRAKKGADDFKQEANDTAREAAASFDGSAESVGDAFQEVAANAFQGFGPAGAAAGLAIAAGIGAGTAAFSNMAEAAQELKDNLSSMYQDAAEEGRAFLSEAQIQAEASRVLFDDRDRIREEAKSLGVDVITLARAYGGDVEAINTAISAGNDILDERNRKNKEDLETLGSKPKAVDLESEAIRQVLGLLEEEKGWHDENKASAQQVNEMQKRGAREARTEAQKTQEALKRMVSQPYTARVNVDVNDRTGNQVQRIVNRINGRIASIQISAGINGRQVL